MLYVAHNRFVWLILVFIAGTIYCVRNFLLHLLQELQFFQIWDLICWTDYWILTLRSALQLTRLLAMAGSMKYLSRNPKSSCRHFLQSVTERFKLIFMGSGKSLVVSCIFPSLFCDFTLWFLTHGSWTKRRLELGDLYGAGSIDEVAFGLLCKYEWSMKLRGLSPS